MCVVLFFYLPGKKNINVECFDEPCLKMRVTQIIQAMDDLAQMT